MALAELLPTLNALLNATAAALMISGFVAIRRGRPTLHRNLMLGALGASALFLVSYGMRMALTGTHRYPGTGVARTIYLTVLGSHTVLAVVALPLVLIAAYLSLVRHRFDKHRAVARVALPIWTYVSVTGVAVYLMLYRFAP